MLVGRLAGRPDGEDGNGNHELTGGNRDLADDRSSGAELQVRCRCGPAGDVDGCCTVRARRAIRVCLGCPKAVVVVGHGHAVLAGGHTGDVIGTGCRRRRHGVPQVPIAASEGLDLDGRMIERRGGGRGDHAGDLSPWVESQVDVRNDRSCNGDRRGCLARLFVGENLSAERSGRIDLDPDAVATRFQAADRVRAVGSRRCPTVAIVGGERAGRDHAIDQRGAAGRSGHLATDATGDPYGNSGDHDGGDRCRRVGSDIDPWATIRAHGKSARLLFAVRSVRCDAVRSRRQVGDGVHTSSIAVHAPGSGTTDLVDVDDGAADRRTATVDHFAGRRSEMHHGVDVGDRATARHRHGCCAVEAVADTVERGRRHVVAPGAEADAIDARVDRHCVRPGAVSRCLDVDAAVQQGRVNSATGEPAAATLRDRAGDRPRCSECG